MWTVVSHKGSIAEVATPRRARDVAMRMSREEEGKAAVYDDMHRARYAYSKGYFLPRKWWKHDPHRLLPRVER